MPRSNGQSNFFEALRPSTSVEDSLVSADYAPAPDDWRLVVTDVEGSTAAIEAGRHKAVNFVGASSIAALKNLCAPAAIPYQFGGDGATLLVPPGDAERARVELARVRGFAKREYDLTLRVAEAPVSALRARGRDVLVARYEPLPGNHFAIFKGGGVDLLELAMKRRGAPDLVAQSDIPPSLDDGEPPNMSGLSCRWSPLMSRLGKMVSLIVRGEIDYGELHRDLTAIVGDGQLSAVGRGNLIGRWPPPTLMLEARARRGKRWLPLVVAGLLLETLLARVVLGLGRKVGDFDPAKYTEEITRNTGFARFDDTFATVFDCPEDRIPRVRAYLEARAARGELTFGLHMSQEALMTCLVTSATQGLHVHFVDGGDGGYTSASKHLKKALAAG